MFSTVVEMPSLIQLYICVMLSPFGSVLVAYAVKLSVVEFAVVVALIIIDEIVGADSAVFAVLFTSVSFMVSKLSLV